MDALLGGIGHEPELGLDPVRDHLEELRDRLRRVVEEERGDAVEEDADRQPQGKGGSRNRHAERLEVGEAADRPHLRVAGLLRRRLCARGIAVDEGESGPLGLTQPDARRLRSPSDFTGMYVQGDEHDALVRSKVRSRRGEEPLELAHPRRPHQQDRVVTREGLDGEFHGHHGVRSGLSRFWSDAAALSRSPLRAIRSPTAKKASSTFSPVLALVDQLGAPNRSAISRISPLASGSAVRSAFAPSTTIGTEPLTRHAASIQSAVARIVAERVKSPTARIPCRFEKYASLSSSRKDGSPMMSQIVRMA